MQNDKDPFGFGDAISIDHLSDEQINQLEEIFKDYKD
jgi:hypothetical protein